MQTMSADYLSAMASLGTLLVVIVTAIAAFVQLRHMGVTNRLMVLNAFREHYEAVQADAAASLGVMLEQLETSEGRSRCMAGSVPTGGSKLMPLMRLFELLGSYTNRKFVPLDVVCDAWAPVILGWWTDCSPVIAVMRRNAGPTLFENWESIAVASQRSMASGRSSYPKRLPHMIVVDPWADADRETGGTIAS